jgi:hypothetical protein
VAQETVPWECVVELIERGAQVTMANRRGIRPADLAHLLPSLQHNMVAQAWPRVENNQGLKNFFFFCPLSFSIELVKMYSIFFLSSFFAIQSCFYPDKNQGFTGFSIKN